MADEDQELIDEARKSLEQTEKLREESGLDDESPRRPEPEGDESVEDRSSRSASGRKTDRRTY